MGLYYKTVLRCVSALPSAELPRAAATREVLLGLGQAIDAGDVAQGFVRRADLLRVFGYRIAASDIETATHIVEYETSTLGFEGPSTVVSQELPIR